MRSVALMRTFVRFMRNLNSGFGLIEEYKLKPSPRCFHRGSIAPRRFRNKAGLRFRIVAVSVFPKPRRSFPWGTESMAAGTLETDTVVRLTSSGPALETCGIAKKKAGRMTGSSLQNFRLTHAS